MSKVEVLRSIGAAQVFFSVDQRRCQAPFEKERSAALGKRFSFALGELQEVGERLSWVYRKGICRLTEARRFVIDAAQGNELEMAVTTEGSTDDALDALQELWAALGEAAGDAPRVLDPSIGVVTFATTAVVRLPKSYRELFPGLEILARHTRKGVEQPLVEPPGVEPFRVSVGATFALGALVAARQTVIEPRMTATVEDRVFHTSSPLTTEQHLAMLEELCEKR